MDNPNHFLNLEGANLKNVSNLKLDASFSKGFETGLDAQGTTNLHLYAKHITDYSSFANAFFNTSDGLRLFSYGKSSGNPEYVPLDLVSAQFLFLTDFRLKTGQGGTWTGVSFFGSEFSELRLGLDTWAGKSPTTAQNINFQDCTFPADFSIGGFNLAGATFFDTEMTLSSGLGFYSSTVTGVNFGNANLTGVNFTGLDLTTSFFNGANVTDVIWGSQTICPNGVSAQTYDFTCCGLGMNDLIPSAGCPVFAGEQVNLQLAGQPLKGAIFTNANLSGGTLEGANLSASVFHGTALTNVNLSGANLELATFKGANLNGVNLSNADLRNVDFEGTTLNTVDMSGATLTDANLNGTDLSTTTLTGVNQPVAVSVQCQ